jgi:hypothetical protein
MPHSQCRLFVSKPGLTALPSATRKNFFTKKFFLDFFKKFLVLFCSSDLKVNCRENFIFPELTFSIVESGLKLKTRSVLVRIPRRSLGTRKYNTVKQTKQESAKPTALQTKSFEMIFKGNFLESFLFCRRPAVLAPAENIRHRQIRPPKAKERSKAGQK